MDLTSIEDFEKITQNEVIKIEHGKDVFYMRMASSLSFDIVGNLLNTEISQEQRGLNAVMASICDDKGRSIFKVGNKEHEEVAKNLPYDIQVIIMNKIQEFFNLKKKSKEAQ